MYACIMHVCSHVYNNVFVPADCDVRSRLHEECVCPHIELPPEIVSELENLSLLFVQYVCNTTENPSPHNYLVG